MKTKGFIKLMTAIGLILCMAVGVSMVTGFNSFAVAGVIYVMAFIGGYSRRNQVKEPVLGDFNIQDTTYAGTYETGYFITKATFGLDTIKKGVAFVKDGIKKRHNIGVLSVDNPMQPRVATPTQDPAKKFTITGRTLEPADLMTYMEVNPRDFESHFISEELNRTLLAREIPVTAANFMIQYLLNKSFEQVELGIHMGSTTYTAVAGAAGNGQIKFFDGIIKKLLVAGTYIPATAPAALTISNIQTKMQDAYKLLPKALLTDPTRRARLRFCLSLQDWLLYEDYLATSLTYKSIDTTQEGIHRFKGIPVITLAGLPKDTFYLCEATPDIDSNIWVGTNSTDDLQLMFKPLQNNSELWFMKGLYKFDTQVRVPEEFVMHTTKVIGDFSA